MSNLFLIGACFLGFCFGFSGAVNAENLDALPSPAPGQVFSDCDACPEMVVIPAGIFELRKPAANKAGPKNDKIRQRTTAIRQFALGKTEVTQRQWKAVMGRNPSKFSQ